MEDFSCFEIATQHKKVIVLLMGWRIKKEFALALGYFLSFLNFHVLIFDYKNDILSSRTEETSLRIIKVAKKISNKCKILIKQKKDITLFGTSLGSLFALLIAKDCPEINKIILNTSGAFLSDSVWSWSEQQSSLKKDLIKKKISLKQLQFSWKDIEPINIVSNIRQRISFLVLISKNDKTIPYIQGVNLVNSLEKSGHSITLKTFNSLSHFFTGVVGLISISFYLKWIKKH